MTVFFLDFNPTSTLDKVKQHAYEIIALPFGTIDRIDIYTDKKYLHGIMERSTHLPWQYPVFRWHYSARHQATHCIIRLAISG